MSEVKQACNLDNEEYNANEDIQKAQEVIALMDEIIQVCDEHRKN